MPSYLYRGEGSGGSNSCGGSNLCGVSDNMCNGWQHILFASSAVLPVVVVVVVVTCIVQL